MRWVDHWLGLPMCFFLGLLVQLYRRIVPARTGAPSGRGTLVVAKFLGLGSIVQAIPLLRALRQGFPEAHLVFLTFPGNRILLERLGLCSEVRIIRTGSPVAFVLDVLRTLAWMRRRRVEAMIDLEFFSKFSTLITFMSGARIRVGYHLNDLALLHFGGSGARDSWRSLRNR